MTNHQTEAPKGTKRFVVFDTNAYRNLTFGLTTDDSRKVARKLADAELSTGTKALANPLVIWELIAHLADPSDLAYENCMNSVVALVEHTRNPEDNKGGVCRMADGETEICRQLFNRIPQIAAQNFHNLSMLASYVWRDAPTLSETHAQTNFKSFGAEMDKKERAWLDHIEKLLDVFWNLAVHHPPAQKNEMKRRRTFINSSNFIRQTALGKVINCANLFDLKLSNGEIEEAGIRMETIFSTSLKMMQKTFAVWFDSPDVDLRNPKKKRGNFIWDTAICYGIGGAHTIGNAPIVFVTDDKAICKAAKDANCAERVIEFKKYKKILGTII